MNKHRRLGNHSQTGRGFHILGWILQLLAAVNLNLSEGMLMGCWLGRFGRLGGTHFLSSGLALLFSVEFECSPPRTTGKVHKLCGVPADPTSQSQSHALAQSLLVACGQNVIENKICRGVLAGGLQLALYLLCARRLL